MTTSEQDAAIKIAVGIDGTVRLFVCTDQHKPIVAAYSALSRESSVALARIILAFKDPEP